METKTIAWKSGSGNITLTYTGQGNGSISVSSDENDSFDDRQQSINIVTTNGSPEKAVSVLVKQRGKSYPVGYVFNFEYTGSVQQVTLPKGKYKLQCWGAQGGVSYGSTSGESPKGGYSEGIITLEETTAFYIFVGGQGSSGYSDVLVNGGWNGGGASVGRSSYNSGETNGYSYPASGGGATDISTVTSSMSYSSGRTNRNNASLLARCIVAGGGAGGSYRKTEVTTESENFVLKLSSTSSSKKTYGYTDSVTSISKTNGRYYSLNSKSYVSNQYYFTAIVSVPVNSSALEMRFEKSTSGGIGVEFRDSNGGVTGTYSNTTQASGSKIKVTIPSGTSSMLFSYLNSSGVALQNSVEFDGIIFYRTIYYRQYNMGVQSYAGKTVRLECIGGNNTSEVRCYVLSSNNTILSTHTASSSSGSWDVLLPDNANTIEFQSQNRNTESYPSSLKSYLYARETTSSTSTTSSESDASQHGGGTSGKGKYPGTQSLAGSGGAFGLGANQSDANYRYCAGGGGGGWYGGGTGKSNSSASYINYSGGGSGFVNIEANASYRPSGYTGLQLDSGTTKDGATSFESVSGGNETGHSGNGYARITVLA